MSLPEHMNRFGDPVPARFGVADGRTIPGQFLEIDRVDLVPALT